MSTEEISFGEKIIHYVLYVRLTILTMIVLSEDCSFRVVAKKYYLTVLQSLKFYHLGEAGMAQCLECLPPIDVAHARFLPSAMCGSSTNICCW